MAKHEGPRVTGVQASLRLQGSPVGSHDDAVRMVHAAWPNLRFAALDVEPADPERGVWLIPIPLELVNVDVSVAASPSRAEAGFIEIVWP